MHEIEYKIIIVEPKIETVASAKVPFAFTTIKTSATIDKIAPIPCETELNISSPIL